MPISLQFYNTTDNPKKINKTLSAVGATISLAPFEDFDLENPYVIINNGVAVGNYAKIDNNYFFAEQPILMTGNRKMVRFTKDVLMSNRTEILQTPIIVERSTTVIDSWMADVLEAHTVQKITQNYLIGDLRSNLNSSCKIVLAVVGSEDVI